MRFTSHIACSMKVSAIDWVEYLASCYSYIFFSSVCLCIEKRFKHLFQKVKQIWSHLRLFIHGILKAVLQIVQSSGWLLGCRLFKTCIGALLTYWTSVYGSITSVRWGLTLVFYSIIMKFVKDALFLCLSNWRFFIKIKKEAKTRMSQKVTTAEENEKAEWWHLFTVTPNIIELSCSFLLAVGPTHLTCTIFQ